VTDVETVLEGTDSDVVERVKALNLKQRISTVEASWITRQSRHFQQQPPI
jgi:hypothetical protein